MAKMDIGLYEPNSMAYTDKPSAEARRSKGYVLSMAVVFVVCLCVYVSTMSRSISGGDAGELAVSACQLGVAHPPGYPLFTLLYHLAYRYVDSVLDPWAFAKPAFIFNAVSAVLMSLAMTLLSSLIWSLTRSSFVAIITTLTFAFSPTIWLYSGTLSACNHQ